MTVQQAEWRVVTVDPVECRKNPTAQVHEYSYGYTGIEGRGMGEGRQVNLFFCKWCLHREVVDADPVKGP